jgi:hypothetical protein
MDRYKGWKLVNGFLLSNMAVSRTENGVVISVRRDHIVIKMKRGNKTKFFTDTKGFGLGDKCLVAFSLTTGHIVDVYQSGHKFDHKTDIEEVIIATKEEMEVFEMECSRVQDFDGVSVGDGEITQPQESYSESDLCPDVLEEECSRIQGFEGLSMEPIVAHRA